MELVTQVQILDIALLFILIPSRKAWIHRSSFRWWVNSRADWIFSFWKTISLGVKIWIQISSTLLKNWPNVKCYPYKRALVNTYVCIEIAYSKCNNYYQTKTYSQVTSKTPVLAKPPKLSSDRSVQYLDEWIFLEIAGTVSNQRFLCCICPPSHQPDEYGTRPF